MDLSLTVTEMVYCWFCWFILDVLFFNTDYLAEGKAYDYVIEDDDGATVFFLSLFSLVTGTCRQP